LALALLAIIVLGGSLPSDARGAVATKLSGAPAAISLSTIPAQLPADNNTYPALIVSLVDANKQPTLAMTNLTVFLTSSQENVGEVNSSVEIGRGEAYAIADFVTTNNAGSTTVTATTSGLKSTSTSVTTVVAVGYPTRFVITAVPGTVPARASNTGKLLLELEDTAGLPAKAVSDTSVTIYSSNTNVANVAQASTTMKQGQYLEEIDYASGFIPGAAVITASAAGFDSGVTTVTVQGSPPLALKLFAQPDVMVACSSTITSCTGRLVVALTDLSGNPTRASSNIQVQIRSSDLGVVDTSETATIEAGNISATAAYAVTSTPGVTTMTASAPGLQSGFAQITTVPAGIVSPTSCTVLGSTSCQLKIFAGPDPVLADHRSYSSVVVSLGNGTSPAINMTGATKVTLTSSITGVGNFTQVVFTIPEGQNWAAVTFTSTFQVGTTQLTASAQNILPVQTSLSTYGSVPSQVVLTPISGPLPADGGTHPALELSLEDAFGSPAVAPFDLPVNLSSSHADVVRASPAIIPSGQTFAVVNVTSGILAGSANVTALQSAFTSGYAASSTVLTTIVPAPSALAAFLPDNGNLISTSKSPLRLLAIQLQDSSSNPARARTAINVTITSSNSAVIRDTMTASFGIGADFVAVPLSPLVPGTTTLTFSSPGLASAYLPVTFLPDPIQITISGGPASILTNQTAIVSVSVLVDGTPFEGATVQWNVSSGTFTLPPKAPTTSSTSTVSATVTTTSHSASKPAVSPASPFLNDTTAKSGSSTVIYKPSKVGVATITAVVNDAGLQTKTLNFTVTATPAAPAAAQQKQSLVQELTSFPLLLVPVGGAAGGGAAAFFLVRRRGKRGGADEEFDTGIG
jgi:hypothetical protein